MKERFGVVVVGGGIIGASAAYYLAQKGRTVLILDQYDVPNQLSASGDHLRAFRVSHGKDAFYSEMAMRSIPLWLDWNTQANDKLLVQNGFLELAVQTHGFEEQGLQVMKELKVRASKMDKDEVRRNYPMINTRAIKYAVFQPDGGTIWAWRTTGAIAALAQRRGAKLRSQMKVVSLVKEKGAIKGVKDSSGKLWQADAFLFSGGPWTPELLKSYRLPIKVTRQHQLYLRPPANRGRYRPEHFPVFACHAKGFYGFPLHIHGFLKIAEHKKGPPGKPGGAPEPNPAFEKKCRAFLKRFIPELASFTDSEASICHYDNTPDGDFIIDRLPDVSNGYVACGFAGRGFKFAPLIGKTLAELISGGKPELNLHRFRLGRFKGRG
ncbi:MAG: FAD-dependent oxidoreductase [Elusimicrobia bacterium]|nr:FAD-dependent oxidoreductase [Elusimicrobiota bacterium]